MGDGRKGGRGGGATVARWKPAGGRCRLTYPVIPQVAPMVYFFVRQKKSSLQNQAYSRVS